VAKRYRPCQTEQALLPPPDPAGWACAALALRAAAVGDGGWGAADGFRLNRPSGFAVSLTLDDVTAPVRVLTDRVDVGETSMTLEDVRVSGDGVAFRLDGLVVTTSVVIEDASVFVMRGGDTLRFRAPVLDVSALAEAAGGAERIVAPMPGEVINVAVQAGDVVRAGQVLLVIEAMKMEHSVTAPRDGSVAAVACAQGDRVEDGVELVTLES